MNISPRLAASPIDAYLEAVEVRLERLYRVDLDNGDPCAQPSRPPGHPFSDPAIADDDDHLPRDEERRRPQDPVEGALPSPVAVVEEVLRLGVVYCDDRISQLPLPLERCDPHHPRGRLLAATQHAVQSRGHRGHVEVGAVVYQNGRLLCDHLPDAPSVFLGGLPLPGPDLGLLSEERGDVVLGGERVRRRQLHVGPGLHQGVDQDRGLLGDMEADTDGHPAERLPLAVLPGERVECYHVVLRPEEVLLPLSGEFRIGYLAQF